MRGIVLLAAAILALGAGCTKQETRTTPVEAKDFGESRAVSLAGLYQLDQELDWGDPVEIVPEKVDGRIVQYTLVYGTPEGEGRAGDRRLLVTEQGEVTRSAPR